LIKAAFPLVRVAFATVVFAAAVFTAVVFLLVAGFLADFAPLVFFSVTAVFATSSLSMVGPHDNLGLLKLAWV
jgi:hypothetical protein